MAQLSSRTELSLKNILVVTNFSAASLTALTCIVPVAKESGSVIHLLHVISPETEIASEADHDKRLQTRLDAQRELGALDVVVAPVPYKMSLREGNVWASSEELVQSEHIDLIVVGTSGGSDFIESGTEEIISKAVCPVLTVGPNASPSTDQAPLAQLLYLMNLWEGSHDGLEYAIQVAIRYKSRLLLLHIIEHEQPQRSDYEWLSAYRRIMRNLLPESAADLVEAPELRVEVAKNMSARVHRVADEVKADLVVMDVPPEQSVATHLPQKLYEIISRASCPVLTVRSMRLGPAQT